MIIYFAGSNIRLDEMLIQKNVDNRLLSYHYHKGSDLFDRYSNVFLDSGAYSAQSAGAVIDMDEYCEFIKQNQSRIKVYANLDVIGDPVETFKNQKYMEKQGLTPLPTFHLNSDWKYLIQYCKEYEYIALGGMVGSPKSVLTPWLDGCFYHIKEFWPIKVHAFGMTSFKLLYRYPFYSADSTSWQSMARYGTSRVVDYRTAKFRTKSNDYDINSLPEIQHVLDQQHTITKLWQKRKITWTK